MDGPPTSSPARAARGEPASRHRFGPRPSRRITIVDDVDELDALAPGWERLERHAATPMQTAAWASAAARSLHPADRLEVVMVGDPDHPRAVAPLARGRARAELIGAAALSEPGDLLYAGADAVADLTAALTSLELPLLLRRLPRDAPSVAALRRANRLHAGVLVRAAPGHPTLELGPGWTAPEGMLSGRRGSDLRRARRHAERIGEVAYEIRSPAPEELEPLLAVAIDVEAAGWKSREGSALRSDARRLAFFRGYARGAAARGELRLCLMRIGGRAAAMQLAVEWRERLWLLKIGYDETFKRCSPGMLLLLESTRWAAGRGLRSVEFLGQEAPWTAMWTERVRPCVTVAVYPPRARGIAALAADAARLAASHAARRR